MSDSGGKGIAGLMASADRAMKAGQEPPEKPKTPPKVEPKVEARVEPKVKEKPDDEEDIDLDKVDRTKVQAPKKFWRAYDKHREASTKQIKDLTDKIAKLDAKPSPSIAESKKLTELEARLKQLTGDHERVSKERSEYEKRLAAVDYTKHDDYKKKYVEPLNKVYGDGVMFTEQLEVSDGDNARRATQADFDHIRKLPLHSRIVAAKKMFGEFGTDVVNFTRQMDDITTAARMDVDERSANYEKEQGEMSAKAQREAQEYSGLYDSAIDGLRTHEEYGKWFSPDEKDPEFSRILGESEQEITEFKKKIDSGQMTPAEHAGMAAAVFLKAAAFDAQRYLIEKHIAREKALEEELTKFRGADPGAEQRGAGKAKGGGDNEPTGGIAGAVASAEALIGSMAPAGRVNTFQP